MLKGCGGCEGFCYGVRTLAGVLDAVCIELRMVLAILRELDWTVLDWRDLRWAVMLGWSRRVSKCAIVALGGEDIAVHIPEDGEDDGACELHAGDR